MERTKQKQLYAKNNYRQIKVNINPDVAKAFKEACAKNGHSQASVIEMLIARYAFRSELINDYSSKFLEECSNEFSNNQVQDLKYKRELLRKINKSASPAKTSLYDSLSDRRKEISLMLDKLVKIYNAEVNYINNMPGNLSNSIYAIAAAKRIEDMEEIIELLNENY